MRLVLVLALSTALLAPPALAEHDLAEGPLSVETRNGETGDGCDGRTGSESRDVVVRVDSGAGESLYVLAHQSCSFEESGYWHRLADYGTVMAGRSGPGGDQTLAMVAYAHVREGDVWGGWEACDVQVHAAGVGQAAPCPPTGDRWPMLPALP